jgi:hypothetical protein
MGIIAVPQENYKNHNNKSNNSSSNNCGGGSIGEFACGGDGISGYGDICVYFQSNLPDTLTNYLLQGFYKLQVVCTDDLQ